MKRVQLDRAVLQTVPTMMSHKHIQTQKQQVKLLLLC